MTRERFVVGAAVIGLIAVTVVLFVTSLASVDTVRIDSFQRSADPHKIIVNPHEADAWTQGVPRDTDSRGRLAEAASR